MMFYTNLGILLGFLSIASYILYRITKEMFNYGLLFNIMVIISFITIFLLIILNSTFKDGKER